MTTEGQLRGEPQLSAPALSLNEFLWFESPPLIEPVKPSGVPQGGSSDALPWASEIGRLLIGAVVTGCATAGVEPDSKTVIANRLHSKRSAKALCTK